MNHTKIQYPLLRSLQLIQMGALVVGILTIALVFYISHQAQKNSSFNDLKNKIQPVIMENHEQWLAWKFFDMDENLKNNLADISRQYPFAKIKILQMKDLPRELGPNQLVVPQRHEANLMDYSVLCDIDPNYLPEYSQLFRGALAAVVAMGFLFVLIVVLSGQFMKINLYAPLSLLKEGFIDLSSGKEFKFEDIKAKGEMKEFILQISGLYDQIQKHHDNEVFNSLTLQVAHDIRSPLEVLKGIKSDIDVLPVDSRRRIQMSINRIEEIAHNLLKTRKQNNLQDVKERSEELLAVINSVVTEKKIEFRNREGLEIQEMYDSNSFGLFSVINRRVFKSIISNLINNGIESLNTQNGEIQVNLFSDTDQNIITISDNGGGIPSDVAERLFTNGFTTKVDGNGIGLSNAKKDIESVGGTIEFKTQIGHGTTFIVRLPKSSKTKLFIGSVDVYKYEKIIVLDDDPSFHEAWTKRLEGVKAKIEHIHSVEEILNKYETLPPTVLLLSDFELMDKNHDGLDTIIKLGHAEHSLLVTARSEEVAIQDRCLKAGIKLLPKSLVNYVKVVCTAPGLITKAQESVVLIDDDRLVHLNWASFCKKSGLPFQGFRSIDEFIAASSSFDKNSKIYIDSNLGDGIQGEFESEKIFAYGFINLYLATGHEKDSIQKPLWIKEIFSKSPENIDLNLKLELS